MYHLLHVVVIFLFLRGNLFSVEEFHHLRTAFLTYFVLMASTNEKTDQKTAELMHGIGMTATTGRKGSESPEDKTVDMIEKVVSGGGDHDRIDPEVAKYASGEIIEIDEATNTRLKRMIYRRVLVIMTITYFFQALDKGTLSYSSIMNLKEDTGLMDNQVNK